MSDEVENPLDKAGEAVRAAGEGGSNFLFGISDFLEQVTGNAFVAAVFGFFLLFSLTLIKGASASKDHKIYSKAVKKLGFFGLLGLSLLFVISFVANYRITAAAVQEKNLINLGVWGKMGDESTSFLEILIQTFSVYKWYGMVFIVMVLVGHLISQIESKKPV